MKKSILNLKGAQELTKNEQKSINGGRKACVHSLPNGGCDVNQCCSANNICVTYGSEKCKYIKIDEQL